jgi:hypothetical protein
MGQGLLKILKFLPRQTVTECFGRPSSCCFQIEFSASHPEDQSCVERNHIHLGSSGLTLQNGLKNALVLCQITTPQSL